MCVTGKMTNLAFDKNTVFASLQGVNANEYTRTSVGAGYRLTGNTHVKIEYVTNSEEVPAGVTEPKNNQIALLFTTKF